ncbi:hypothetical protein HDU76_010554, partial [Blyttiomyces sp. JEL0837]
PRAGGGYAVNTGSIGSPSLSSLSSIRKNSLSSSGLNATPPALQSSSRQHTYHPILQIPHSSSSSSSVTAASTTGIVTQHPLPSASLSSTTTTTSSSSVYHTPLANHPQYEHLHLLERSPSLQSMASRSTLSSSNHSRQDSIQESIFWVNGVLMSGSNGGNQQQQPQQQGQGGGQQQQQQQQQHPNHPAKQLDLLSFGRSQSAVDFAHSGLITGGGIGGQDPHLQRRGSGGGNEPDHHHYPYQYQYMQPPTYNPNGNGTGGNGSSNMSMQMQMHLQQLHQMQQQLMMMTNTNTNNQYHHQFPITSMLPIALPPNLPLPLPPPPSSSHVHFTDQQQYPTGHHRRQSDESHYSTSNTSSVGVESIATYQLSQGPTSTSNSTPRPSSLSSDSPTSSTWSTTMSSTLQKLGSKNLDFTNHEKPTLFELLGPHVPNIDDVNKEFEAFQSLLGWLLGAPEGAMTHYAFWKPMARGYQFGVARLLSVPKVDLK